MSKLLTKTEQIHNPETFEGYIELAKAGIPGALERARQAANTTKDFYTKTRYLLEVASLGHARAASECHA